MKFIVQKSVLLDALTVTGKCISKSIMPIMESYLFKIDHRKLVIIGGNLEVYMEKEIVISSEIKIDIALPAARLFGLVKEMAEQPLLFTIGENTVNIEAGTGSYEQMPFIAGIDYPVQTNKEEIKFEILSDDLMTGIGKTIFACGTDHTRPVMTGVNIAFEDKQVTYTGTNATILATYSYPVDIESKKSFIVPVKVLSILLGLVPNTKITIKLDARSIVFEVNHSTVLRSRLIDERYPEYRGIIPKDNDKKFTVGRHDLLTALKRVAQFPDDSYYTVALQLEENKIKISSQSTLGESAHETMGMEYAGETVTANFNGKMLISCLSNLTAETIRVSFKSAKRAFLVRSDDAADDPLNNLMLLMPIGN